MDIDKFVHDQLSVWPEAARNFRALKATQTRQMPVGGLNVTLQFNPGRISSSTAEIDEETLRSRSCFLCHRPDCQHAIRFEGRKGRKYDILTNLFPIFPNHLVIGAEAHVPQSIWHRYVDMLDLAEALDGYIVYYNGPVAGASAPDHMHFQACPRGYLPLERAVDRLLHLISAAQPDAGVPNKSETVAVPAGIAGDIAYIASVQDAQLFHYKHFTRGVFALRARTKKSMAKMFYRLLDCAPFLGDEKEPRFNAFTYFAEGEYRSFVICRSELRSHQSYATGADHYTISPGAVEMAGYFITPDADDFRKADSQALTEILDEVSISPEVEERLLWRLVRTQPRLEVGILSGAEIVFEIISDGAGPQKVSYREGKIDYNGALYDELCFEAPTISTLFAEPSFILYGVTIGIDFHWQRQQDQTFAGTLKFIAANGKVTAVNVIGVEDYLLSVISSEMRASASLEFLKAHAVISRSWLLAQMEKRRQLDSGSNGFFSFIKKDDEIIRWYDREDHTIFDVCADDHCQRYQGITKQTSAAVEQAISETRGQILTYEGEICDARFSKCCGGQTEEFQYCWEDTPKPYLISFHDPYCNTTDRHILSQVLNDYDQETPDFYRWTVEYTQDQLTELVCRKLKEDFGVITDLIPLERGKSGRIWKLKIVGTKKTLTIGKELEIRRALSETHLLSSAFDVERHGDRFVLHGRGWGHGVGLCQIGAAVMGEQGKTYDEILLFYYRGAQIQKLYE